MASYKSRKAAKKKQRQSRGRRGGTLQKDIGAVGMATGVGAVAQYASTFAQDKVEFAREKWWGEPLVLGLLGLGIAATNMKAKKSIAGALGGAAGYAGAQNYRAVNPGKDGMILSPFLGAAVAGALNPKALSGAAEQQAVPGGETSGYGSTYETSNYAPGNVNVEQTWDEFETSGATIEPGEAEEGAHQFAVDDSTPDDRADSTSAEEISAALSDGSDAFFS